MLKILVTNDDGIEAEGMARLVKELGRLADVYVAAPSEQQSGKSQSITFRREVRTEERDLSGAVAAYTVDGTPADCVKWALCKFEEEGITPDYVISGINMGYNAGLAQHYSGTIAAAREGALNGIRSIALSAGSHEATHFDYLLGLLPRLIEMSSKLSPRTILSVNAPDIQSWKIKGLKVVPVAPFGYGEKFAFERAESGDYQMKPFHLKVDGGMRYDFDWLLADYATVSPIPAESADPVSLLKLNGLTEQNDCLAVIVDAQLKTAARVRKAERFVHNIGKFAHAVSRTGTPMIVTETFAMGSTLASLEAYTKDAEKVEHIYPDAWTAPDMEKHTAAAGACRVVMAGTATNVAVLQTALGFVERGYDITILEDCCAAAGKSEHKRAISLMEDAGCHISTLETEVMRIASSCSRQVLSAVADILND